MKIYSTSGTGDFQIKNNKGEKILQLVYANWFSSNAKTEFNETEIEIKPKNFWCSSFDIFQNGIDKGDLVFNWKGNVIITIRGEMFMLKAVGFWNLGFELLNEKEEKIFLMKPNLNWKKLKYDYDIELTSEKYDSNQITELLIYAGFGANLYMTSTMA